MLDKARSFTATLSIDGQPITVLREAADDDVWVVAPGGDPSHLPIINASQALGTLSGPNEAWAHERELGLVDFNVVEAPPTLLYLRHSAGRYRMYIRSGAQFGQGVFTTGPGLLEAQPITAKDPALWQVEDATSGQPLDLASSSENTFEVRLTLASNGAPVTLFGIHSQGGYLAVAQGGQPATLSLSLVEREADWLG